MTLALASRPGDEDGCDAREQCNHRNSARAIELGNRRLDRRRDIEETSERLVHPNGRKKGSRAQRRFDLHFVLLSRRHAWGEHWMAARRSWSVLSW